MFPVQPSPLRVADSIRAVLLPPRNAAISNQNFEIWLNLVTPIIGLPATLLEKSRIYLWEV